MTDVSPSAAGTAGRLALVTGATGYIGGQLVPALLDAGWRVRVLTRGGRPLPQPWGARVEVATGDASDPSTLRQAMTGADTAYFLLHSMDGAGDFAQRDRVLAQRFAAAAESARLRRIVYLGGLHPHGVPLSAHLASRAEVGDILLAGSVPAVVLQAAVVVGAGSASFDMLRYLACRLPAMVAPKWLHSRVQPIAIGDVVRYLVAAPDLEPAGRSFDIGGPEVLTYRAFIDRFTEVAGLRRRVIVTVPVLTTWLASHWVGLVTPLSPGLARPLVDSLVHDAVCREDDIHHLVPAVGERGRGLIGLDEALSAALADSPPDTGPRNLAVAGALTGAAAVAGAILTDPRGEWYRSLDLPPWQPPPVAFPVVWTALYADIAATSAATLTELDRRGDSAGSTAYRRALIANLVLNATWSGSFFRSHRLWPAAAHATVLAASSADLVRRTRLVSPAGGRRLLPYAAWTAFATLLNAEVARRNPRRGAR